jgi:hypothetical protein
VLFAPPHRILDTLSPGLTVRLALSVARRIASRYSSDTTFRGRRCATDVSLMALPYSEGLRGGWPLRRLPRDNLVQIHVRMTFARTKDDSNWCRRISPMLARRFLASQNVSHVGAAVFGLVNYPALKGRASSFNGNCLGPKILLRFRSGIPSTSRSRSPSGQYPETFVSDISRRVDILRWCDLVTVPSCSMGKRLTELVASVNTSIVNKVS